MPIVETEIEIDAAAADVYALAKCQERFSDFMPDVESVDVLERDGARAITRWRTIVEDAPLEWTEEDRFDDVRTRIEYRLLAGDLDRFDGTWSFEALTVATSRVRLSVDFDFGVPTLAELIGPTLERKVRENAEMMLAALKREAEGTPVRP